jgi:ribose 5-phosphate isomerase B
MTIYLGADHRGFALKEKLKAILTDKAYNVIDVGASSYVPDDDYPDFAKQVAEAIMKNPGNSHMEGDRGILICGSGFGMEIAANKFASVRAVLPASPDQAYQARHDDDANVIVLGADFIDENIAAKMVSTFLSTPFAGDERYKRRLDKIDQFRS